MEGAANDVPKHAHIHDILDRLAPIRHWCSLHPEPSDHLGAVLRCAGAGDQPAGYGARVLVCVGQVAAHVRLPDPARDRTAPGWERAS